MKNKVKTKDCHLVVKIKLSFGESVNDKELDFFARTYLRGFLKPVLKKKNQIEYTGPIGISLQERMRKPITRRDFLFIMEQIVVAVQKLQANNLYIDKVLLDIQHVYINEVTREIQFIYLPLTTKENRTTLMELIEAIIYSALPIGEEDGEAISKFSYFVRNLGGFQPDEIEKYILREDRSIVNTIKKQNAGQSGFMTNKQLHYYEHYGQKGIESEDATALLEEEDATALLIEEEEATAMLVEDEDEKTGLLVEDDTLVVQVHYPKLVRVQTGEEIAINKQVFRLGKEKSCVDYFVSGNVAVSRSHADMVTRGNKVFVKDLNSRNHTYINNQLLAAQCETEIYSGDTLKLANEEFTFYA